MEEMWKDIPGFEGIYQASTEGNIRSLKYNSEKGKIKKLKPVLRGEGYYSAQLCDKDKKKHHCQWGRLIALTYIPNPENKPLISYIDGNKLNNHPSNLEWITYQELGVKNYPSKNIEYKGKIFRTEKQLAEYYGISEKNFNKRKRRGWTLEEILTIPVDKSNCCAKPYYYNYYGKMMTLEEISKQTGVKKKVISDRILAGWDLYSAAEIPANVYKRRVKKDEKEKK